MLQNTNTHNGAYLFKDGVSGKKIDLEELDLSEICHDLKTNEIKPSTSKSKKSRQKKNKDTYKGVKNYLSKIGFKDESSTVNIEAEVLESSKQKKYSFSKQSNSQQDKRIGSLPYKDMLAYYVKGEKVMKGGIKHTTSPTYEDIANKFNCSYGAVTAYAAKHNWVEKRKAYRERMTDDFSFAGQMAADINCEVLSTSRYLIDAITEKVKSPTFMPKDEDLIEKDGRMYVITDESELIPLAAEGKKDPHYSQIILSLTKSLDTINRICNSTIQVEVDNAYLLEEEKESLNGRNGKQDSGSRMRQIELLQERLREGS